MRNLIFLFLSVAVLLAGCGLEGPPVRPQPEPETEQEPRSGVTITGSGYMGVGGRF